MSLWRTVIGAGVRARDEPRQPYLLTIGVLLVATAVANSCVPQQRHRAASYELVISGGRVIDPDSGTDAIRNAGISGGTIQSVSVEPLEGQQTIDAAGLIVAPGFIDLDSYAHLARFSVRDGVTTALDIRRGTANVGQWYAEHEKTMLINLGVGMGYSLAREEVMGRAGRFDEETRRQASEPQLKEILRKIQTGLDEGAVAIGMGPALRWPPPYWELLETLRIATVRKAHVVTTIHDVLWRETDVPSILGEIIGAAAITGAAVHIPHFTSSGGPHVGRMLAMLGRARERGLDITVEDSPYTAAMINVQLFDAQQSDAELQDIEILATGERLNGKTVARYAAAKASAIVHNSWIEPFVVETLRNPVTSIASHGYIDDDGRGHPRTSGTFSRVLGRYVRQENALSLVDAIRKMTLSPARRLEARVPSMRGKERIRQGADADIVIFDPMRILDRATFKEPTLPPDGLGYVLVNGVLVVRDSVLVYGVYPGRPIRAPVDRRAQ